ncbi:MAG: helix-turn-helix domain-containing protein [Clostridia bacterium]|nr:helix-turn-helix domain-containing protein [Clostridia bacterium]
MGILHEQTMLKMVFTPEFMCTKHISCFFHWHENAEFLYIIKEGFKIIIDGVLYEPRKGDFIFIREYSAHCFLCENDDAYMNLGQVSPKVLMSGHTEIKPIKPYITADEINEDPVFEQRFSGIMKAMETVGRVNGDENNLFAKSLFSALYFLFMEKFPDAKQSDNFKRERKEFYRIMRHIQENVTQNITIINIAEALDMDRKRVSRIFLKYAGMSLNEYINNLRVQSVNELLDAGYSVTDAAMESGFQSMRAFNSIYKKITSKTPTQYLKGLSSSK